MKFTDLFIERPVLSIVVSLLILVLGLRAIFQLPVSQFPQTENAVVTVTTTYYGADAQTIAGFITQPLEAAIAQAQGIDYLSSNSSTGVSVITATLRLNYDSSRAMTEINTQVASVRNQLPPQAQQPVITVAVGQTIDAMYLGYFSDTIPANSMTDYLVRVVQPRLTAVEGVQKADILGARTFAMRIWLKPDRMAALNVSPAQVRQALAANNYLAAVGSTKGALVQVNLTANTDLRSVDEFKRLIIRQSGGAVVRLSDVADVVLGAEDYDTAVAFTGETAVFMGIWALPNANSLDVIKRIRVELASIQKELPEQITATMAYDSTKYIQSAIDDVVRTLRDTLLIVVIVIFLFLGSFRSVLVPVVAIPVSLIGAVFLMQVFGFTLNLLTLLAIVLSVGLVVDDAIVVVENVERHLSEGRTPLQASLIGARERVGPIIAMTITLATVYIPIAFQGGLTGSLFREFALTLAGAVTISGVVALTLSPMMSRYLLHAGGEHEGFAGIINRGFDRVRNAYGRGLDLVLHNRPVVYVAWGVFVLLFVGMYTMRTSELAPAEDQGVIFGIINTPANSTLDQLAISTSTVNKDMMAIPEAQFTFQITNPGGGFWGVGLKPWDERKRKTSQVLPEVQQKIFTIPGIETFAVLPPALPGGGTFPVEIVIASTAEESQILEFAKQLQQKAAASGKFWFPPPIDVKIDQPQSEIDIDREKVAQLNLNLQQVGQDLGAAAGGNFVNRFSIDGRSYKVIPQLLRTERLNPEQLDNIYVTGPNNQLVKLSSIATIKDTVVPRSLNRFQQLNAVKISGVAASVDEGLKFLEDEAAKILPQGYKIDYTGESRQLRVEGGKFLPSILLALVLIFLVLAAQFNSFRDPLVILLGSVPLAFFGAMLPVFLKMPNPQIPFFTDRFSTTFNIYSQVGLVTLVGLISKNGILIVEFANKLQEAGKTKLEAVKEASMTRLRPILMTSIATIAGHFPLTYVTGPGAAARNSIGRTLVTGMAVGTFFTLFFVPVIYILIARDHRKEAEARAAELKEEEGPGGGGRLSPTPAAQEP